VRITRTEGACTSPSTSAPVVSWASVIPVIVVLFPVGGDTKSPIGTAVRYALSHWAELGKFLDDARIPLDNNASERALRRVALGRKNYLFVGDVDAGRNIAGLYSLVATCEARGINPFAYLADVLPRVSDHPNSRIDELLPGAWAAAHA
jgi:transposase